jgi:hypothetical protein
VKITKEKVLIHLAAIWRKCSFPPIWRKFVPPIWRKYVWPPIWRKFVLAQVFPTQSLNPNVNLVGSLVSLQFYRFATGFKKRNHLYLHKQSQNNHVIKI